MQPKSAFERFMAALKGKAKGLKDFATGDSMFEAARQMDAADDERRRRQWDQQMNYDSVRTNIKASKDEEE